ncbi:MAG: KpsF/GutQ family sugar-phosphate isomerase [Bacteroidales bacterium]|nr:KpsF/GutQ family sugar-phosphate isomerase [Bacteroidales bacterium]
MLSNTLQFVKEALQNEANAILDQIETLDAGFERAVESIINTKGKIVVTGMGKSGIIARKIAATLASTGSSSFYMHPGEAFHGDLGMVSRNDLVIALSNSGETDEILKIIPFLKENRNTIIAMCGNPISTLTNNADIVIAMKVPVEACPYNLAPTTSTTVMLALGDAMALAAMKMRNFTPESYARFHPGGSLGKRLLQKVEHQMKTDALPIVAPNSQLTEIINTMSKGRLGMALVNQGNETIGIITDGDLRRLLENKGKEAFDLYAENFMTINPKKIKTGTTLHDAESFMNKYKITSLIVTDANDNTIGVIQIYDLH